MAYTLCFYPIHTRDDVWGAIVEILNKYDPENTESTPDTNLQTVLLVGWTEDIDQLFGHIFSLFPPTDERSKYEFVFFDPIEGNIVVLGGEQ